MKSDPLLNLFNSSDGVSPQKIAVQVGFAFGQKSELTDGNQSDSTDNHDGS